MEKPRYSIDGDDAGPAPFYLPSHTDSGTSSYLDAFPPPIRRQRLRSLPLAICEDDAHFFRRTAHLGPLSRDTLNDMGDKGDKGKEIHSKPAKPETSIRSLIRRASISLKSHSKPRRASHSHANTYEPAGARPITSGSAWHKLKSAASFINTKPEPLGYGYRDHVAPHTYDDINEHIPGKGNAPPIIPRRGGGEAARATAAAQNEVLRQRQLQDDLYLRSESAVELSLPYFSSPKLEEEEDVNTIARVDFIAALPGELTSYILSMLDHQGLTQASKVSRTWYQRVNTNYVWKGSFFRAKSSTFAMGQPVNPGTGLGLPPMLPEQNWKQVYKTRQELERNWRDGEALAIYLHGHTDSIYCVQFDEHKIITGSRDKTFRVWDMHTYKCQLVVGPPGVISQPSLLRQENGDETHFSEISAESGPYKTNQSEPEGISYPIHHDASILCLQYDTEILVTGSSDGTCIIHSIKDNYKPIRKLEHHTGAVLNVAFDDKYIISCSKDCTICVWDRATGEMLKQLHGHTGPVNAVQMRGKVIVSCSGDFSVRLWNIETGKSIREFTGHTKGLACSQLSNDARYIASAGNDRVIRIWDANTGDCLRTIDAHDKLVRSLHIDSISGRLVSGSYDQDIKVFDMESGELLLDFPKWHGSWVLGAKSDYRRIISTGHDRKILIMDFGHDVEDISTLESEPLLSPTDALKRLSLNAWVERDEEERRKGWAGTRV